LESQLTAENEILGNGLIFSQPNLSQATDLTSLLGVSWFECFQEIPPRLSLESKPCFSVNDRIPDALNIGGDHRQPAARRLYGHNAESFHII
jgi:hypothetical protein